MGAGRGRMGRIERIGGEVKETVDRLLRGGASQRDILEALKPLCAAAGEEPISRSGLNRYSTAMEEVGREIREARALADAWTSNLGEEPVGQVTELMVEILRTAAFQLTMRLKAGDEIDVDAIQSMALAMQRIERAAEVGQRRERERRAAFASETSEAVDKEARRRGISPEVAKALRDVVEGGA